MPVSKRKIFEMTKETGTRANITRLLDDQVSAMTERHSKVLPVRADFRFPQDYGQDGSNREMQRLLKNTVQHYRNQKVECCYAAVREQNVSDHPHYHALFLLDGNKVQSPYGVAHKAQELWKDIVSSPADGLVDFCKPQPTNPIPPLRMIRRPSSKAGGDVLARQQGEYETAIRITLQHGEYLAKERTKGNAPAGVREVLASQVRKKGKGHA